MRKLLFWLFSLFLFVTLPALAQVKEHGSSSGHQASGGQRSRNSGHASEQRQRQSGHASETGGQSDRARVRSHSNINNNRQGNGSRINNDSHRGINSGRRSGEVRGGREARGRDHYDGRRFDRGWFGGHYGRGNYFYWGRCEWFGGPRFGVGSWFWFNDAYFVILEPIPYDWYDDEVYVDEYGDGYVLINPRYPGVYFRVGVRF